MRCSLCPDEKGTKRMKAPTRERIKTGFKVLAVAVAVYVVMVCAGHIALLRAPMLAVASVWIISFITGYIVEHQSCIHWRDEKGTDRTVGI